MHLTKHTDYAFRVLLYLASKPEGELAKIPQICEFYQLSQSHISKIVMKLVQAGYVSAFRGKGGGIRLAKVPDAINVGQVLAEFEPGMRLVNCREPYCALDPVCTLKGVLNEAAQEFVANLERYSLADLMNTETRKIVLRETV
jgi:Rrf2 family nitric oxide-sensitive transcriptional repressor